MCTVITEFGGAQQGTNHQAHRGHRAWGNMGNGPAALPQRKRLQVRVGVHRRIPRWAEAEPLEDKCAATVAAALVRSVITSTAGHPKLLISDQGSEFKGDLADAVKMLRVTQRYTVLTGKY